MGWLQAILALIQLVPAAVGLFKQVIAIIHNHPQGPQAGVLAVKSHLAAMSSGPKASDLKTE